MDDQDIWGMRALDWFARRLFVPLLLVCIGTALVMLGWRVVTLVRCALTGVCNG